MKKIETPYYITLHKNIIDEKISFIKNHYKDAIPLYNIIKFLTDENLSSFPYEITRTLSEIISIKKEWVFEKHGDLLGYIYMELQNQSSKKVKGQFFTPNRIVSYITDSIFNYTINPYNIIKILDPSCGSGQFITAVCIMMKKILLQHNFTKNQIITYISDSIYGFDIDPISVLICKYNMSIILDTDISSFKHIKAANFLVKKNVLFENETFFDIIVGNPPWGGTFTKDEKKYYKSNYYSAQSGINSFSLFMERSSELLKPEGNLGFLIPEAFLNIKAHSNTRKLILNNFSIKDIALWGEQFKGLYAPSVSLIVTKENDVNKRESNIITIRKKENLLNKTFISIPQNYYSGTINNIFSITFSKLSVSINDSLINNQDCFFLKDKADFFLGIVTGNNPMFIKDHYSDETPNPIIVGKDVSKYKIDFSGKYINFDPQVLQQTAPAGFYKTKNKVIYKFIGKNLTFALDTSGYYTLNNVNGFIPNTEIISNEALVSILNSKLIQYYYESNFFTVKVLKGNLEKIPIKRISETTDNKLKYHYSIASTTSNEKEYNTAIENIDDIICFEYGVNPNRIQSLLTVN